ncbi:hypothetical protein HDV62DRAFT_91568 [Trichoderma sp. SZMC 28011]
MSAWTIICHFFFFNSLASHPLCSSDFSSFWAPSLSCQPHHPCAVDRPKGRNSTVKDNLLLRPIYILARRKLPKRNIRKLVIISHTNSAS